MGRVAQVICFAVRASLATVCTEISLPNWTALRHSPHCTVIFVSRCRSSHQYRIPLDCYFLLAPGTGAVTREDGVKWLPWCWPVSCGAGNSTACTANVKPLPHR